MTQEAHDEKSPYRAGCRRTRNPALRRQQVPDYAGACHRAAPCADPVGSNPPYGLQSLIAARVRGVE
jgi:hypothetical protein